MKCILYDAVAKPSVNIHFKNSKCEQIAINRKLLTATFRTIQFRKDISEHHQEVHSQTSTFKAICNAFRWRSEIDFYCKVKTNATASG